VTALTGPLMDRRAFLAGDDSDGNAGSEGSPNGDAAAAGLPSLPVDLPASLFALGVASGDPLPDSVILWTRLVAEPLTDGGGMPPEQVPVSWEIATGVRSALRRGCALP
jgi:alkaline phosphatase D